MKTAQTKPEILTLPYGMLESCSHLLRLGDLGVLIDPAVDPVRLPQGWPKPKLLIATHGHIDHIHMADRLRDCLNAPLAIYRTEADCLFDGQANLSVFIGDELTFRPAEQLLGNGQVLQLTNEYSLEVIHTPGHSRGSICLLLRNTHMPLVLFSGDTIFAGAVGRIDLPGGDEQDQIKSLSMLLQRFDLPDTENLPIYPGHGPATTLAREKRGLEMLIR